MNRLPAHRGLELAASYRETLVGRGIIATASEPVTDQAFDVILAEERIMVARIAMSDQVSAVYMRSDPYVLTLVNRMHTVGRQRFSLAHELCHHLFHGDLNTWVCATALTNTRDEHEKEANEFASAFLLPARGVGEAFFEFMKESSDVKYAILKVCLRYRTSWQNTLYRLSDLGLIRTGLRDEMLALSVNSIARDLGVESDLFATSTPMCLPLELYDLPQRLHSKAVISDRKFEEIMEAIRSLEACGSELPEVQ